MAQRLARRPAAKESGAVDDLGPALLDRLEQFEIILRIELEVRILD
jgi:hypothetical protein